MANTVNKHIRVDENDWNRIENAARERGISPTRLLISTTLEAIDARQWPRAEVEIYLLRSAMFAAQAIARDMRGARARRRDRRDRPQYLQSSPGTGVPPNLINLVDSWSAQGHDIVGSGHFSAIGVRQQGPS